MKQIKFLLHLNMKIIIGIKDLEYLEKLLFK